MIRAVIDHNIAIFVISDYLGLKVLFLGLLHSLVHIRADAVARRIHWRIHFVGNVIVDFVYGVSNLHRGALLPIARILNHNSVLIRLVHLELCKRHLLLLFFLVIGLRPSFDDLADLLG